MRRNKGFTLIELMIVVAIIAIIAAIAIPNLLGARRSANEAAAIANLRTVSTACEQFRVSQVPPAYPADLLALSGAGLVDQVLGGPLGQKSGYNYVLTGVGNTYTVTADPISAADGTRGFFLDESGVIRHASPGPATVASTPIE